MLLNFYDVDVFDYYYNKAQSTVEYKHGGTVKSASVNTNVAAPKGLVVRLNDPVEAGDVLTVTLKSKIAGRSDKTFTVNLTPNAPAFQITFNNAPGTVFCAENTAWQFSANVPAPYELVSVTSPATSVGNGVYSVPSSETRVNYTYSHNGCYGTASATVPAPVTVPKPVISLSANSYCDDASDYTGVWAKVANAATTYYNSSYPARPFAYTITESGGASRPDVIMGVYDSVFVRSNSAATGISVVVKAENAAGCVSTTSDAVNITRRVSPVRPVLSGEPSYCGTASSAYVVHNNPQYGVQYWLYDVTSGERYIKHKGANFWIFRPDQHDPKAGAPTEVNEDAYYDMQLPAGRYELRATHDQNSCVTVGKF